MKWRGFRQDQRSVSEIYGTLLIISLAFVTALLLVGGGWVIVDQIQTEAEDSLAQDNVENIDQGINDLASGSVNETKTFEIPENTGEDYEADSETGIFIINVTTDEEYRDRTKASSKSGQEEIILGTIRHEAEDGTVTAFQGGGLWRQPPNSDTIFIESTPNLNYADGTLNLGIVNLTNAEAITEGSEITATRNSNTRSANNLQEFLAPFYTDRYNKNVTAPIQINITIKSEYAEGWAKHARNNVQDLEDDDVTVTDNEVVIEIPQIGDGIPADDSPEFGDEDILYSGSSDLAYRYQNDSAPENPGAAGSLRNESDDPDGPWPYRPTFDSDDSDWNGGSGTIPGDDYEIAVYNESGQWLIYNNSIDRWETADRTVVNAANSEVLNSTSTATNATETPNASTGDHEYYIDPPAWNGGTPAPVCIVTNTGPDAANVRQHLDESGKGCLDKMVGIDDGLVDPIPSSAEFNITVDGEIGFIGATRDLPVGSDTLSVEVNLTNEGDAAGQTPIGVYVINETNWNNENLNNAIPVGGETASNNTLSAGESTDPEYSIPVLNEMAGDDWIVFATNGRDVDWVSEDGTNAPVDPGNAFEIDAYKPDTNFEVEKIDVEDPVKEGDSVEVAITVNETKREILNEQTQEVLIDTGDRFVNKTEITLGPSDWKDEVTMEWRVADGTAPEVTLTASTEDDDDSELVNVTEADVEEAEFEIDELTVVDNEPHIAGDAIEVELQVTNEGETAGNSPAELTVGDGSSLPEDASWVENDAQTQIEPDKSGTLTLVWDTDLTDQGEFELNASIDQEYKTTTLDVESPDSNDPELAVEITESSDEVEEGGVLNVTAEVSLADGETAPEEPITQEIVLENFDGGPVATAEVTLNNSVDGPVVPLTWQTFVGDSKEKNWDVDDLEGDTDGFTGEVTVTAGDNATDTAEATITPKTIQRDPADVVFVHDESGSMTFKADINDVNDGLGVRLDQGVEDLDAVSTVSALVTVPGDWGSLGSEQVWKVKDDEEIEYILSEESLDPTKVDSIETYDAEGFKSENPEGYLTVPNDEFWYYEDRSCSLLGCNSEWKTALPGESFTSNSNEQVYKSELNSNRTITNPLKEFKSDLEGNPEADFYTYENQSFLDWDGVTDEFGELSQMSVEEIKALSQKVSGWDGSSFGGLPSTVPDGMVFYDEGDPEGLNQYGDYYVPGETVPYYVDDVDIYRLGEDPFGKRIDATKTAVSELSSTLGDQAGYVRFDSEAELIEMNNRDLTSNFDTLNETMSINHGGATQMKEGLEEAEEALTGDDADEDNDPYIVLLSDGQSDDDDSPVSYAKNELDDDITVFTVGLGEILRETPGGKDELKEIANATSGEFFFADNASELAEEFEKAFNAIKDDDKPEYIIEQMEPTENTVDAGQSVNITLTINNTGVTDDPRLVVFKGPNNVPLDSEEVEFAPDAGTQTVTFTWDTPDSETGTLEVAATTSSDRETANITLESDEPDTNFVVDNITKKQTDVTIGNAVQVTANITNKNESGEQTVLLNDSQGDTKAFENLYIASGDTKPVELEWNTLPEDVSGTQTTYPEVQVLTADGSQSESFEVTITDPSETDADVLIDTMPSDVSIDATEVFKPSVELTTDGDVTTNATVWMVIEDKTTGDRVAINKTEKQIGGTGTTTVTPTWKTDPDDSGTYEFTIETEADDQTGTLEVREPTTPFKIIDVEPADDEIVEGDQLNVSVTVENTQSDPVEEAVTIQLTDARKNIAVDYVFNKELKGGQTDTFQLTWDTWLGTGDDDAERTVAAEIPTTDVSMEDSVLIKEQGSNLDGPSIGYGSGPVEIDLSEIEIGT